MIEENVDQPRNKVTARRQDGEMGDHSDSIIQDETIFIWLLTFYNYYYFLVAPFGNKCDLIGKMESAQKKKKEEKWNQKRECIFIETLLGHK